MIRLLLSVAAGSLLFGLLYPEAYALNEPSHEVINEQAAIKSSLDQNLKEELRLSDGIRERLKGKEVFRWIREGGSREDEGTPWDLLLGRARFLRHFHDPLQPWDRAGLSLPPFIRFESSVRWAQRANQDGVTGHGNYSWSDARRYYLTALTAERATEREQAFADTFRALGQVMHLIVDASVPEHVRDDMHPLGAFFGNYEYWVSSQHPDRDSEQVFIGDFLGAPIGLDPALFEVPIPSGESVARVPIARLFDSDRYRGTNPEVTGGALIGIAEVANANFLSEDTRHGQYPHPARANMERYLRLYTKTGRPHAYYKLKPGFGLPVDPVAQECVLNEFTGLDELCVDTEVWRETARHMLPRAVGYSAGLLDYFFRGKLDVKRELDPATDQPSLRIVNRSPEPLGKDGGFALYQDDDQGIRSLTREWPKLAEAVSKDNDATPLRLAIPADLPESGLTLVYKGPLGLEAEAVIGKALQPVVVEQVYRDSQAGEWILRTADGLYVLPLETVAGLTAPLARVTWGDRDNQLVGLTQAGGSNPYEALLFELDRPSGSAQVPTAGTTPAGRPKAAVRLVTRLPLYDVLSSIDLQTTVDFAERFKFTQHLVTYRITTTCWDLYNCTQTIGGDTVSPPVKTWSDAITVQFPLALDPARHWPTIWNTPPPYQWTLVEVRADRAGHLLAVVMLETTRLPEEEAVRRTPLLELDSTGALVESSRRASFWAEIADPAIRVVAVVDLTDRRLVAKSSMDAIHVQKTWRGQMFDYPFVGVRQETVYMGDNGEVRRDVMWAYVPAGGSLPDGSPFREGLRIPEGWTRSVSLDGLFRLSLAALGLEAVEARGTKTVQTDPWPYRNDPDGTAVVLAWPSTVAVTLGPAEYLSGIRWSGPSPGWLRFETHAWESSPGDVAQSWLVNWNLAEDTATVAYAEIAPEPHFPITSNASGALTIRWDQEGWRWIPWTGEPLAFPERTRNSAWDYVALDPDYLYNTRTGHFHTLLPNLPEEQGPPALAPSPYRSGRYHVVGR